MSLKEIIWLHKSKESIAILSITEMISPKYFQDNRNTSNTETTNRQTF